ncbi:SET domain-containing protein [Bradyrhizobium sp. S3.2.12]|uniref:SET domain-containing protein n=1 Tax=Bradyrhizobium sp. S3.2.12 TaxID=3156387 RepID=UPI00339211D9
MTTNDHACETSSWLFVGPSKINGFGLFSRKPTSSGAVVGRLGGTVLETANKRTIQIDRRRHLCSDCIDFINHSCRPNAYVVIVSEMVALKALNAIASESDEITIDYNCSEYSLAEPFMCRCCQDSNYIAGYEHLMKTNQHDYLRRINQFSLLHLVQMSDVGGTKSPKSETR